MSELDYLFSLAKTLEFLVKKEEQNMHPPLAKDTKRYAKTVQEALPKLADDETWKGEQVTLIEEYIYDFFKKYLLDFGVSGKICKDNPSFIEFLKALS